MLEIFQEAFADGRDVVLRDGAADHGVGEGEPAAARQRLDLDLDIGELAVTAALALEAGMLLAAPLDRLLVGHLRAPSEHGEVVFRAHAVERDLQMDVALPPHHHLARVVVVIDPDAWAPLTDLGANAQ